jgi:hypothetical protein
MPLEQLEGGTVSATTDEWALAVLTYEALTGENPFAAQTPQAAILRVESGDPPAPSTYVPSLPRQIGEVLLGPNHTSLRHDEAITGFAFPAPGPEYRSAFAKIGSRTAVSVARLSAALVVRFDASSGPIADAHVALGAVGEVAFRAPGLEETLEGRPADEETARVFAEGCVAAVQESIPGRYSLPYKQHAAVGLAYDAWNMLALGAPCEPAWA